MVRRAIRYRYSNAQNLLTLGVVAAQRPVELQRVGQRQGKKPRFVMVSLSAATFDCRRLRPGNPELGPCPGARRKNHLDLVFGSRRCRPDRDLEESARQPAACGDATLALDDETKAHLAGQLRDGLARTNQRARSNGGSCRRQPRCRRSGRRSFPTTGSAPGALTPTHRLQTSRVPPVTAVARRCLDRARAGAARTRHGAHLVVEASRRPTLTTEAASRCRDLQRPEGRAALATQDRPIWVLRVDEVASAVAGSTDRRLKRPGTVIAPCRETDWQKRSVCGVGCGVLHLSSPAISNASLRPRANLLCFR